MALVDYKTAILNSLKDAQDGGTDIFDLVSGYSITNVWLTGYAGISWNTASGGIMDMAESDIFLNVLVTGQLLGIAILSTETFAVFPADASEDIGVRILVNSGSPLSVTAGDVIRIVETQLGVGDGD